MASLSCQSFILIAPPPAREIAYKNGQLAGSTNEDDGELLPQDYIQQAKPVAERRMALAGHRLADLLKSLTRP